MISTLLIISTPNQVISAQPPCSTEINENEMEKNGNRNGKMILAAERVG